MRKKVRKSEQPPIRDEMQRQVLDLADEWRARGMPSSAAILEQLSIFIRLEMEGHLTGILNHLLNLLRRCRDDMETTTHRSTGSAKTRGGSERTRHVLGDDGGGQPRLKARRAVRQS